MTGRSRRACLQRPITSMLRVPRALCARSTYMALCRLWLGSEVQRILERSARGAPVVGRVANLWTLAARLERKGSASAGSNVISEPRREAGLIEVTARQREDGGHDFFLGGINAKPVQPEEEVHGLEGHPLVPIDEWVVLRDPEPV